MTTMLIFFSFLQIDLKLTLSPFHFIFPFLKTLPSHVFRQLHQLRQHTSATVIMPSEGTAEEGRASGARPAESKTEVSITTGLVEDLANGQKVQWNPSMRHFVLLPIKSLRWDHKQPVSVPALLLLSAHWSCHELSCLKQQKKWQWTEKL